MKTRMAENNRIAVVTLANLRNRKAPAIKIRVALAVLESEGLRVKGWRTPKWNQLHARVDDQRMGCERS